MVENKKNSLGKLKVLCVCGLGLNRSRYLAKYLGEKGYDTKWRGLESCDFNLESKNLIGIKDIEWADIIVVSKEKYKSILNDNFKVRDKKIVCLDIVSLRKIDGEYSQLRRELESYLILIKKSPIKINLNVNREVNFLMILYQIIKNQNNFKNFSFEGLEKLNEEDKEILKSILRDDNFSLEVISRDEKLKKIYLKNKKVFESYWNKNKGQLDTIKKRIEERCDIYDFSIFERVGMFFDFEGPREVNVYICLGNETKAGTGNAFSPNIAFLFPREFGNFSIKTIDADFAVLIHEIMHLFQNMCSEPDKILRENVARCFAPRGILINEEKYDGDRDFFEKVKSSFQNGKNYFEIREDLLESDALLGENKIELKGGSV